MGGAAKIGGMDIEAGYVVWYHAGSGREDLPCDVGGGGKMTLRFRCECGQKLRCPEEKLGKRAKCPKCSQWVRVPESMTYDTTAQRVERKARKKEEVKAGNGSSPEEKIPVVVADSAEGDRKQLVTMLTQHGYRVFEAGDGPQAVDLIREKKPHCAVLDVKLDILSGFQVMEQLRSPSNPKNDVAWKIPVIMTTAKMRGRDKQYSMSLGAKAYLVKPLMPAQICPKVEKEVARYVSGR